MNLFFVEWKYENSTHWPECPPASSSGFSYISSKHRDSSFRNAAFSLLSIRSILSRDPCDSFTWKSSPTGRAMRARSPPKLDIGTLRAAGHHSDAVRRLRDRRESKEYGGERRKCSNNKDCLAERRNIPSFPLLVHEQIALIHSRISSTVGTFDAAGDGDGKAGGSGGGDTGGGGTRGDVIGGDVIGSRWRYRRWRYRRWRYRQCPILIKRRPEPYSPTAARYSQKKGHHQQPFSPRLRLQ